MGTVSFLTSKLQPESHSMACIKFSFAIALLLGFISISIQNDETTTENIGDDANENEPIVLESSITQFNSTFGGKQSRFGGRVTSTTVGPEKRVYCPVYYYPVTSSRTCNWICYYRGYRYYYLWSSLRRCYCCN